MVESQHFDDYIYPISVDAGTFDFSVNKGNPKWTFEDGSVSNELRPTRTLSSPQTVLLEVDDFTDSLLEISDNDTNSAYTGDLSDLPPLNHYLNLAYCTNITGDLSSNQTATSITLTGTGLSSTNIDNSLINLVTAGKSNGTFTATDKTRTSASNSAYNTLISRGWTIDLA